MSLLLENDLLTTIHLHCVGKDGYCDYLGWLGDDINTHHISYDELRDKLGSPSKSGGGGKGFMGSIDPFWLRYDLSDYVIHYTFSEDNETLNFVIMGTDPLNYYS